MKMTKQKWLQTMHKLDLVEIAVYENFEEYPEQYADHTSPDDLQDCWFHLGDAMQALIRYGRAQGWEWEHLA